ncbi:GspE/PulE family protein [Phycisphaera mikurensis]|uniref:Type IV pilus assembly protein PilB n=1 Tax=Phycisphaera mikurensis (strain NBRC 102666 / KCTC 22515 / FYK2301M01) TaxID=1142394 RepID=I0II81_PHYMF|nr:ATPase, T2SS/T4P/T4SS family [Phycisphaera mikurensis]MBB6442468.1 type IV pilus assembly protein PilB [Phycisphaera mikurensis]BAM04969.1 type IV pilus assembly protein PilB [Phycisphaera mikurensis NBRC 102666]
MRAVSPGHPSEAAADAAPAAGSGPRIGDLLVDSGAITPEQLRTALQRQRSGGRRLGEVLIDMEVLTGRQLLAVLGEALAVPAITLRHGLIDPALLVLFGPEACRKLRSLPLFRVHGELTVAMAEPQSLDTIDRLAAMSGCRIRPVLALEGQIEEFIGRYASTSVDVGAFLSQLAKTDVQQDVEVVDQEAVEIEAGSTLERMVEGSPIVNLVNVALLSAIKDGASDVHVEPAGRATRIRYRVDGVLRELMSPPAGMHAAIVSRLKVIGKMDIAEKRLPQEGRVRLKAEGRDIDLRVSSMPTLLGEKLVIRVLDKRNLRVRMEELGLTHEQLETLMGVLKRPHGLTLVTGPTGSGKTTTLYSALDLLRSPEKNVMTVEDPVEYQLDFINQIQVGEAVGLSFPRALRSILRQDPDVIMIGEIRDEATARTAVQAALTGHAVLATLHTNDAPGAVTRLLDMGVPTYLLSAALNGVVAQRLVRTVCPHCRTRYRPPAEALEDAGLDPAHEGAFSQGTGCEKCHNSGMLGRRGVYEVMAVDGPLRRGIHTGASAQEIGRRWAAQGGRTLRDEGVALAIAGVCNLEEALRVTHRDEFGEDAAPGPPPADEGEDAARTAVAA